jgi:hypothetical protein
MKMLDRPWHLKPPTTLITTKLVSKNDIITFD